MSKEHQSEVPILRAVEIQQQIKDYTSLKNTAELTRELIRRTQVQGSEAAAVVKCLDWLDGTIRSCEKNLAKLEIDLERTQTGPQVKLAEAPHGA